MGRIRRFFSKIGGIFRRRKPTPQIKRKPISDARFNAAELTEPPGVSGIARERRAIDQMQLNRANARNARRRK